MGGQTHVCNAPSKAKKKGPSAKRHPTSIFLSRRRLKNQKKKEKEKERKKKQLLLLLFHSFGLFQTAPEGVRGLYTPRRIKCFKKGKTKQHRNVIRGKRGAGRQTDRHLSPNYMTAAAAASQP